MTDAALPCVVRVPVECMHWPGEMWPVVGEVTGWLRERRLTAPHSYRVWEDFPTHVQVHETDDRKYAAVLVALASEGWDGGAKAISLVSA